MGFQQGGGGGGYQPGVNPNVPNVPMPSGPSAMIGWVPPIPFGFLVTPGKVAVTECRKGHTLSLTPAYDERDHTLWCDLCYHKVTGNSGAKQCRKCDVDICERCSQVYSRIPPVPLCPKQHPLVPNQGREGTWACDRCGHSGKNGSMRCRKCPDCFDVCDQCFAGYICEQWKDLK